MTPFVSKTIYKKKKKKKKNYDDDDDGDLRYNYSTLSLFLARMELVNLFISPGTLSVEAFSMHVIPDCPCTVYG